MYTQSHDVTTPHTSTPPRHSFQCSQSNGRGRRAKHSLRFAEQRFNAQEASPPKRSIVSSSIHREDAPTRHDAARALRLWHDGMA